jgi:predicted transglutaminase-like cysteine proteinase
MSQASPANTAGDSSIEMGRLSLAGQGDPFDPVNSVLAWRQVAPSAADPFPPPSSVQALDDVAASPNRYAPAAEVAVWLASLPAGPDIVTARLGLTGRDASSGAVAGPSGAGLVTWTGDAGTVELVPAILTTVAADAGQAQVGPQQAATAPARAADAAAPLAMDSATSALLDQVNLRVNQAIRFVADSVQYGVEDYWTLPLDAGGSGEGECKDYVLEKRRALIEAGAPAADLSIAIVRTTWGETHAVLLVATDRGEIVLDSLSSRIVPWRKAPYRWVERQAPGQQLVWVKVVSGSD